MAPTTDVEPCNLDADPDLEPLSNLATKRNQSPEAGGEEPSSGPDYSEGEEEEEVAEDDEDSEEEEEVASPVPDTIELEEEAEATRLFEEKLAARLQEATEAAKAKEQDEAKAKEQDEAKGKEKKAKPKDKDAAKGKVKKGKTKGKGKSKGSALEAGALSPPPKPKLGSGQKGSRLHQLKGLMKDDSPHPAKAKPNSTVQSSPSKLGSPLGLFYTKWKLVFL